MLFARSGNRRPAWFATATLFAIVLSGLFLVSTGKAAAPVTNTNPIVTSSSLGQFAPTFTGPAATGCSFYGCSLLTGPFFTPSVEPLASNHAAVSALSQNPHAMPLPNRPRPRLTAAQGAAAAAVKPPTVSCEPLGPGCDWISSSSGGGPSVSKA